MKRTPTSEKVFEEFVGWLEEQTSGSEEHCAKPASDDSTKDESPDLLETLARKITDVTGQEI